VERKLKKTLRLQAYHKQVKSAFEKQLDRGIKRIREAAQGRTCGGCRHYSAPLCLYHVSPSTGGSLTVLRAEAPACPQWDPIRKGSGGL
jgi:hypothetical protein